MLERKKHNHKHHQVDLYRSVLISSTLYNTYNIFITQLSFICITDSRKKLQKQAKGVTYSVITTGLLLY